MDALAVTAAAAYAGRLLVAVGSLGTALTAQQSSTLDRIAPLTDRKIFVALDNDPAGQRAAAAAHDLLAEAGVHVAPEEIAPPPRLRRTPL